MSTHKLFEEGKFYIIRAERAGVFMGKIAFVDGTTVGVNAIRRLYRWDGALDVTMIASEGVSNPSGCKFSVQLSDTDLSVVTNVVEYHPMTEKAVLSLKNVPAWKN